MVFLVPGVARVGVRVAGSGPVAVMVAVGGVNAPVAVGTAVVGTVPDGLGVGVADVADVGPAVAPHSVGVAVGVGVRATWVPGISLAVAKAELFLPLVAKAVT